MIFSVETANDTTLQGPQADDDDESNVDYALSENTDQQKQQGSMVSSSFDSNTDLVDSNRSEPGDKQMVHSLDISSLAEVNTQVSPRLDSDTSGICEEESEGLAIEESYEDDTSTETSDHLEGEGPLESELSQNRLHLSESIGSEQQILEESLNEDAKEVPESTNQQIVSNESDTPSDVELVPGSDEKCDHSAYGGLMQSSQGKIVQEERSADKFTKPDIQDSTTSSGDEVRQDGTASDTETDRHEQEIETDDDLAYGAELLERETNGEELNENELFELDMFLKLQEGNALTQDELDNLHLLRQKRKDVDLDRAELDSLKRKAAQGESIDEERLYELELFQLFRDGADLSDDELFELEAFDRLRSGEDLTDEEAQDMEILREQRLRSKLDREELDKLQAEKNAGAAVDKQRFFELEIRMKVQLGEELRDEDVYALELFDKLENGDELTDVEQDDLEILSGQNDEIGTDTPTNDQDGADLLEQQEPEDIGLRSSEKESHQMELAEHADESKGASDDEQCDPSMHSEDQSVQPFDLESLRERRENGLEYDEDLLYQLELVERRGQGSDLDEDELFEVRMFEKRLDENSITSQELADLEFLRSRRVENRLDEEELQALRERKEQGEEVDEDLLHELELFEKMRAGNPHTEDEQFEIEMFQLIRDGGALTEEQIQELEFLKTERIEAAFDEQDLHMLRNLKLQGELVDEEFMYELELFQRNRDGGVLSEDEAVELALFQRRRDGEELVEDDLDELEMLRSRRLNSGCDPDGPMIISESLSPDDEDSVYRRELLDRQMKGQRLDKQEFVWLEILKKKKREEELLEDELDELDVMRQRNKEANVEVVAVKQTRKLLELEMEKRLKREQREQRKKEKAERRLQQRIEKEEIRDQRRKEKEHEKMLKKRRAEVKKMRRKKKQEQKAADTENAATSTEQVEEQQQEPTPASENTVEIVGLQTILPPTKDEPKKGLFGGVFAGRNNKKEQELEEARRRQEELIKEQMKALALENELEELEKEKELQKELVKETVDKKSSGSLGSSSWETDSGEDLDESEGDESSVMSSSDESESESDSDSSMTSEGSFGNAADVDEDRAPAVVLAGRDMHEQRSQRAIQRREMQSRLRQSILRRQGNRSSSDDRATEEQQIIDGQPIMEGPVAPVAANVEDDTSIVSRDYQAQSDEKVLDPGVETQKERPSRTKSKTLSLSAHLRKKNKKRSSRKNKARYGDDISLGTLQLSKIQKTATNEETDADVFDIVEHNKTAGKTDRPWGTETDALDAEVEQFAPPVPPTKEEEKPAPEDAEKFFNSANQLVFERSVFNFNQSFSSRLSLVEEDERSKSNRSLSESESVASGALAKEGEVDTSLHTAKEIEDEMSLVESLASSYVSLNEEKYIFETPDYENIESRLAEKLRHKEAEFDAAWENIVADENVAAQINQRLKERQRTRGGEKKEKKEESDDLYDVPRLFLFEGEKQDSKKKRRKKKRKKKDRKAQKKLDQTLSKEFRKAMKEVFSSDSEEEYDKTFGDDEGHLVSSREPSNQSLFRDASDPSMDESGSVGSDESDDFDHGAYMARLRDRSMQQKVRKDLYESRRQLNVASTHSEMSSEDDDFSQNSELSRREPVNDTTARDATQQRKGKRAKKNRNGELIDEDTDPADVYAKALEQQKVKKTFTIADLRKEMEDLKQPNFGSPPAETAVSAKKLKAPKIKKPKSSINMAGPEGLTPQRSLGNKMQSFTTAAKELGLLSGGKTAGVFGNTPDTIQEYDDDEDAFLTGGRQNSGDFGDGGFDDSKSSGFGFRGAGLSNFSFFGASGFTKTPNKAKKKQAHGSSFGGFGGGGNDSQNGGFSGDDLPGPPAVSSGGFQEPLPLPDMQDEDYSASKKSSMFGTMGKSSKRFMSKFKIPLKRTASSNHAGGGGFMMDDEDDQFEGGQGLLG
ncbi:MAG: hypothetical protein SGILL_003530 [Bacillariaceae sp.]